MPARAMCSLSVEGFESRVVPAKPASTLPVAAAPTTPAVEPPAKPDKPPHPVTPASAPGGGNGRPDSPGNTSANGNRGNGNPGPPVDAGSPTVPTPAANGRPDAPGSPARGNPDKANPGNGGGNNTPAAARTGGNSDPDGANGKGPDQAPGQLKKPPVAVADANGKGPDQAPGQLKSQSEPAAGSNGNGRDQAPGPLKRTTDPGLPEQPKSNGNAGGSRGRSDAAPGSGNANPAATGASAHGGGASTAPGQAGRTPRTESAPGRGFAAQVASPTPAVVSPAVSHVTLSPTAVSAPASAVPSASVTTAAATATASGVATDSDDFPARVAVSAATDEARPHAEHTTKPVEPERGGAPAAVGLPAATDLLAQRGVAEEPDSASRGDVAGTEDQSPVAGGSASPDAQYSAAGYFGRDEGAPTGSAPASSAESAADPEGWAEQLADLVGLPGLLDPVTLLGVPLADGWPVDLGGVEAWARDLLVRLGVEPPDDDGAETYAWALAAALLAGGVAVAASRPRRRPAPDALVGAILFPRVPDDDHDRPRV